MSLPASRRQSLRKAPPQIFLSHDMLPGLSSTPLSTIQDEPRKSKLRSNRHEQKTPEPSLKSKSSRSSIFDLFSRPKATKARGYTEGELTPTQYPEPPSSTHSNATSHRSRSQSRRPPSTREEHVSGWTLQSTPRSAKSPSRTQSHTHPELPPDLIAPWVPPPLFQAYPQAIIHSTLLAQASSSATSSRNWKTPLKHKALESDGDQPARWLNHLTSGHYWTRKIYILSTSGYVIQYSGSGHYDRQAERYLRLGPKSAAFASDLIPGKHFVLQITESKDQDDLQGGMFTKMGIPGIPSGTTRRLTSNMLLIFDDAEGMENWMNIVRKEIDTIQRNLKGRSRRRDAKSPNPPTLSHRYNSIRDPERPTKMPAPSIAPSDASNPPASARTSSVTAVESTSDTAPSSILSTPRDEPPSSLETRVQPASPQLAVITGFGEVDHDNLPLTKQNSKLPLESLPVMGLPQPKPAPQSPLPPLPQSQTASVPQRPLSLAPQSPLPPIPQRSSRRTSRVIMPPEQRDSFIPGIPDATSRVQVASRRSSRAWPALDEHRPPSIDDLARLDVGQLAFQHDPNAPTQVKLVQSKSSPVKMLPDPPRQSTVLSPPALSIPSQAASLRQDMSPESQAETPESPSTSMEAAYVRPVPRMYQFRLSLSAESRRRISLMHQSIPERPSMEDGRSSDSRPASETSTDFTLASARSSGSSPGSPPSVLGSSSNEARRLSISTQTQRRLSAFAQLSAPNPSPTSFPAPTSQSTSNDAQDSRPAVRGTNTSPAAPQSHHLPLRVSSPAIKSVTPAPPALRRPQSLLVRSDPAPFLSSMRASTPPTQASPGSTYFTQPAPFPGIAASSDASLNAFPSPRTSMLVGAPGAGAGTGKVVGAPRMGLRVRVARPSSWLPPAQPPPSAPLPQLPKVLPTAISQH